MFSIEVFEQETKPLVQAINDDTRAKVLTLVRETLRKNLSWDVDSADLKKLEEIGITLSRRNFYSRVRKVMREDADSPLFTQDPGFMTLYSELMDMDVSSIKAVEKAISRAIQTGNPSLIFVVMKITELFLEAEHCNLRLAKALIKTGSLRYTALAFKFTKKGTPERKALVNFIAKSRDSRTIFEAFEQVESGTEESLVLAEALSQTTDYELIFKRLRKCEPETKESEILSEGIATSGRRDLIEQAFAECQVDAENFLILEKGLIAVGIYESIKKVLGKCVVL